MRFGDCIILSFSLTAGPSTTDFISSLESEGMNVTRINSSADILDIAPHHMGFHVHSIDVKEKVRSGL